MNFQTDDDRPNWTAGWVIAVYTYTFYIQLYIYTQYIYMLHIHSILYIYHYISIKHQIAVINHQGSPLAARVIAPTKHKNSWQCRLDHLPAESPGSTCENWVSKKKTCFIRTGKS